MTGNQTAGQKAASRMGFMGVAAAVVVVLALGAIVASYVSGWRVNFANTAWGAIVAALITAIGGGLLKGRVDAELARSQGEITERVQTRLLQEQGRVQEDVQAQLEVQRATIQAELAELKAKLDDRNSALAARRDYEYEARKRLYEDVEPLLFQVYEALEEAHYRVLSLARSDRSGNLGVGRNSWIAGKGYYLASTVYKLLLPATHLRLMQRRMTFVDLGLDPHIELRYLLLKLYVRSFTDDFVLAGLPPALEYRPNDPKWSELRKEAPAVYTRQALLLGTLESVADLLVMNKGEKSRAISFGEFDRLLTSHAIDDNLVEALDLFQGFSLARKPVLARLLVAQACFARLILSIYHHPAAASDLATFLVEQVMHDQTFAEAVGWGQGAGDGLATAEAYWVPRLYQLEKEISARRTPSGPSGGVQANSAAAEAKRSHALDDVAQPTTSYRLSNKLTMPAPCQPSGAGATLLRNLINFYHQAYRAAVWSSRHNFRFVFGW
jgi:hypothetical protein